MIVINLALALLVFVYSMCSSRRSLVCFFLFLTVIFFYLFFSYLSPESFVHHADEFFYFESVVQLNSIAESRWDLFREIASIHHDSKYYLYILFFSFFSYPYLAPDFYLYANLIFFQSLFFLVFLVWVLGRKDIEFGVVSLFVFPVMVYYSLFLYRDGFVAILLFSSLYAFYKRFISLSFVLCALLYFYRHEFAFFLFATYFVFLFKKKSGSGSLLLVFFLALFFVCSLYFLQLHYRFNVFNLLLTPLAFNGEAFFHQLYLFLSGGSYYASSPFRDLASVAVSLYLAAFNAFFIGGLIKSHNFSMSYGYKDLARPSGHYYAALAFFVLVLVSYLTINDGFGLRVKLSLVPFMALAVSSIGQKLKSKFFFQLFLLFLFFDLVIGLLLVFK
ncbi:hypothetical protein [Halomonas alkalicola]|uniref:hypothetical protein n=1 Tax=Halomonas alkalicola TaxID=1930622 RepID=UPI00265E284C|nr:hypothetical protein [Halomonas alkalicola]